MSIALHNLGAEEIKEVFQLPFIIVPVLIAKNINAKIKLYVKKAMNVDTKNGAFILIVISALLKNVIASAQDFVKNIKPKTIMRSNVYFSITLTCVCQAYFICFLFYFPKTKKTEKPILL